MRSEIYFYYMKLCCSLSLQMTHTSKKWLLFMTPWVTPTWHRVRALILSIITTIFHT